MTAQKPIWTEGLFVTEHHLQQQDQYHETLITERMVALRGPTWGVVDLEVDQEALAAGQIRLTRFHAIFPDGTPVRFGAGVALPPPRAANERFGPTMRTLPVYVGLPLASESRGNLGDEGVSTGRFSRSETRVADFNGGGREQPYSWASPRPRILLGDEPREGFAALQVADVIRTAAGGLALRDTFVPPCFGIGVSDFLTSGVRRVANSVVTRSRSLAASRRQRSDSRIEFDAGDVSKMLLLATLNRAIPRLSHFLDNPQVAPEMVYLELVSFAGDLSTFVPDVDPTSFPKYGHLTLDETFEPLFARLLALINTTVDERYVEVPLKRREDGMYLGRIEDPRILRHEFFLAARGTLSEAEMHQQLPKLSKIASWGQIGPLLNSAVNGARVELEFRPSSALPVRPGVSFFRVSKTPEFWTDIQGTGTIAIYQPLGQDAVTLSLYAVDPENL